MHFSRKLNTCLVEIGWITRTVEPNINKQVYDIYSNREIISTYFTFDENGKTSLDGVDPKKYFAEQDKLFSE
jgi:hypothetical protein